jgi:hypothetical protein
MGFIGVALLYCEALLSFYLSENRKIVNQEERKELNRIEGKAKLDLYFSDL